MTTKKQSYEIKLFSIFYISLFLFFLPAKTANAIEITPDTRVGMKDVVVVNYTLWVESVREDDQEGTVYVVDPDIKVPNSIIEEYTDIKVPPNVGFREGMIGMRAGDNKSLDIPENSENLEADTTQTGSEEILTENLYGDLSKDELEGLSLFAEGGVEV